ncbi:MAG: UDP-3-O-(3-hydroxymyristoyl)glucosamine N-acyltransferase [Selenomonadaceae bacterium]|nr:UDP-3-O-(3-hydroxymyristoyl)glucosamine N-acyltransferase [Selenomonadaceae bacterium]
MEKTLQEISELIGGTLVGDGSIKISGLANITMARVGDLVFAVPPHLDEAKICAASAVLIPLDTENFPKPAIKVAEPRAAFAKLLELFAPKIKIPVGISPKAHIGKDVKISDNATIMPFAVIDDGAEIKSGAIIYPHVYIGQHATIDEDTIIYSSATVREFCKIGKRCVIHSSAVIGSDGFGFTTKNGVHTKVPQVGNVIIEDDVEVGAHVGIDRAAMGSTIIGHGTKIDNLVHIGHNCKIGATCLIVAQTGISGSTTVGDNVTFGGQVGTVGHITIGGNSVYAARSGISKNMPEGFFGAGFPIQTHSDWLRHQAALKKVPEMLERIHQLEYQIEMLKEGYL